MIPLEHLLQHGWSEAEIIDSSDCVDRPMSIQIFLCYIIATVTLFWTCRLMQFAPMGAI